MKFRDSWTLDELKSLIDAADSEHTDLEFKRCDALAQTDDKKRKAAITVSAFANGVGGIVVYGVREPKKGEFELDEGFETNGKITKDWLTNVIDSNVHPHIQGLQVFPIALGENHERFVLLVQVPLAEVEPHQAPDKKYYMRRDGKNDPMTHQEVKDAFFRARYPNLQVEIRLAKCFVHGTSSDKIELIADYDVSVKNVGRVMASDYLIKFLCDSNVFKIKDRSVVPQSLYTVGCNSVISSTEHLGGGILAQKKLFPGQRLDLLGQRNRWDVKRSEKKGDLGRPMGQEEFVLMDCGISDKIAWEVFADNAPSKTGSFLLGRILPQPLLVPPKPVQQGINFKTDDVKPLCLV